MDSLKFKKLEEYAGVLVNVGEDFEREGQTGMAIEKYLKTVDVLLVMADGAPDYPTWLRLSNKADSLQKRVKVLIAKSANPRLQELH